MRNRLYYGKNPPRSFEENLFFTAESPYNIRYKIFDSEDFAPLHYGTAMEIDLFRNISGSISFNKQRHDVTGDILVIFPPQTVHSLAIHENSGYAYILQVSLKELRSSVDVEQLYRLGGKSIGDLVGFFSIHPRIEPLLKEMIEYDHSPIIRCRALMEIFEILFAMLEKKSVSSELPDYENNDFLKVLQWTQEHFKEPVTLSKAAASVCLSENYFCSWFKNHGGITYRTYLNSVRINSACSCLAKGSSIQEAAFSSGFTDISYFTQVFKRVMGCTPKKYAANQEQRPIISQALPPFSAVAQP